MNPYSSSTVSANNAISTGITTGSGFIAGATNLLWEKVSPVGKSVTFSTYTSGSTAYFTFNNSSAPNTFINLKLTGTNVCGGFQGNFHFIPFTCPLCPRMANPNVNDVTISNIIVNPNPTKKFTRVTIPVEFQSSATFELNSSEGIILKRGIIQKNQTTLELDLNNLIPSIYTLTLKNKNNISKVRIVKN